MKANRINERNIICELNSKSDRIVNENDFYLLQYETGYIKQGIRTGDFMNDQKTV
jgi:hypothetical protein